MNDSNINMPLGQQSLIKKRHSNQLKQLHTQAIKGMLIKGVRNCYQL